MVESRSLRAGQAREYPIGRYAPRGLALVASRCEAVIKKAGFIVSEKSRWVLCAGLGAFLLASLFLVDDYGMNIDSQKNFAEGRMNLNYLLTGHVDEFVLQWQMHGAWVFMIAELSKRLFHDALHVYDATAARHVILPFMSALFLVCLFFFVARRWSALHGLGAVGFLLTFPYFWGYSFNNLKDVPLLIFCSLSLMSFVEWTFTRKLKYFYGFFVLWGLALAIKAYAFLVAGFVVAWMLLRARDKKSRGSLAGRSVVLHTIAGLCATFVIVCALYAPAVWGVHGKLPFLISWRDHVKRITWGYPSPFNVNSFVQVFFRTPLFVLIFALVGLLKALRDCRRFRLQGLLIVWFLVPLLIPCFPRTLTYHNGMRVFMVFLVPYCILSAVGAGQVAGFFAKRLRANAEWVFSALISLAVGASLWGVVTTHPYQTTFFNALAGGLGGAQEKNIADSWDYWLNSCREAGRWVDAHGARDANVVIFFTSGLPSSLNADIIRDPIGRADLKPAYLAGVPVADGEIAIPANTYVVFVPFDYLRTFRIAMEQSGQFQRAYTISRQGGEICTVYYKPGGF